MGLPNPFEREREEVRYTAGQTIFEAGQPGELMYVVREGEVDLVISGRIVESVGPEGFFGEMALIENEPRSATAVARTECTVLPIDQRRFTFMVQETPFFAIRVLRVLSARLRRQSAAG
jgi:CRP/FNR family transcriptional regulator, cyclic AMP receptor protein